MPLLKPLHTTLKGTVTRVRGHTWSPGCRTPSRPRCRSAERALLMVMAGYLRKWRAYHLRWPVPAARPFYKPWRALLPGADGRVGV